MQKRFYYVLYIQFLGFRYSGWQKQPQQKTIEGMLSKTLKFVLEQRRFKILGAGRTDAKVSALEGAFELFIEDLPIEDIKVFIELINYNLPSDIKIIRMHEVNNNFNIIKDSKFKEYVYLFSFGDKNHPFCAPFMANIIEDLDIELMKSTARLFEGSHNFRSYTAKPQKNTNFERTITHSKIVENSLLAANFFPERSFALTIRAKGFIRYQVRMIMGALIQLGKGELSVADIKSSLEAHNTVLLSYVAPGSGLLLNKLEFE